ESESESMYLAMSVVVLGRRALGSCRRPRARQGESFGLPALRAGFVASLLVLDPPCGRRRGGRERRVLRGRADGSRVADRDAKALGRISCCESIKTAYCSFASAGRCGTGSVNTTAT